MAKRAKSKGHSARHGNNPAPYTKYDKMPYKYPGEARLARGDLVTKANDRLANKYA